MRTSNAAIGVSATISGAVELISRTYRWAESADVSAWEVKLAHVWVTHRVIGRLGSCRPTNWLSGFEAKATCYVSTSTLVIKKMDMRPVFTMIGMINYIIFNHIRLNIVNKVANVSIFFFSERLFIYRTAVLPKQIVGQLTL